MTMSCDRVGNLLLARFSAQGANDVSIVIPASIVFFLIKHLPVNQDPALPAPPPGPQITQRDWDSPNVPRASTVNCKVLPGKISMSFNLDRKPDLILVLDRGNVELMRQILLAYSESLIDLESA
jgi:hypothetical protein